MENQIKKQSGFHQSRSNEAKLGAYYTDLEHCRMIANLLSFPENAEVCCLEPSIGDGKAVLEITGRKENANIHIFGVELNRKTANVIMENPYIDDCIYGDFLHDPIINESAFSFAFANPPYGESDGRRLEARFLEKMTAYLMEQAVLVYVIPHYVATKHEFYDMWNRSFHTECIYRFQEQEYNKWKQVVLIGRKRLDKVDSMPEDERTIKKLWENVPILPSNYTGNKILVYPSSSQNITDFKARFFDAVKAKKNLKKSPLNALIKERIVVERFMTDRLLSPPIMPNAGQMYLMAISGAGQGKVGDEDSRDLHLQRGVVTNVEESEIRQNEDGKMIEVVQKYTRIHFNIVENSGLIHTL